MGLSSWFKKIFNTEKKDRTYQGASPRYSLVDTPGYRESYSELQKRIQGRGVGYGSDYANKYSSPLIQSSRAQFKNYQLPALKSELSATGRRTGSGGSDLIRRAYQEQGYREGDIYSGAYKENEGQKRREINQSIQDLMRFGGAEAGQRNQAVQFDYNKYIKEVGDADARRQREAKGYRDLLTSGMELGLGMYGQARSRGVSSTEGQTFTYGKRGQYGGSTPPRGYNYGPANLQSRMQARRGGLTYK